MTKEQITTLRAEQEFGSKKHRFLGLILGELDRISKTPTETEVNSLLEKMRKNNDETIELLAPTVYRNDSSKKIEELAVENRFIEVLLPQKLTDQEMIDIITKEGISSIKEIFQYFSKNFGGKYDGKTLSELVKKM